MLDAFAHKHKIKFNPSKRDFYISEGKKGPSDFFLIKPTTFMNLSGTALLDFVEDTPIELENILVVYDDVNLSVGQIRLRKSGSDGGHNGIKSIIYHLQNDQFPRLRFGIGNKFDKGEMADYVLEKFNNDETEIIKTNIDFSVELIENFIDGGYKKMADFFSVKSKAKITNEQNSKVD